MIDHPDWFQYKHVLSRVKKAKKIIQRALKPGGGGANSTSVGMFFIFNLKIYSNPSFTINFTVYIMKPQFRSLFVFI